MSTLMGQARRVPRIAEAAVERARLTVVPRTSRKAPRVPFVTLVSLLLVAGIVGLLLFNTSMQQASFTATAMETRASVLDAKEQSLQMELEKLRDPQKVASRAKELGMVPAAAPAFIRLSDGKVLGKESIATSEDAMQIAPLPTRKPKNLRPDLVIVQAQPVKAGKKKNQQATDTAVSSEELGDTTGRKKKSKPGENQGSER